MRKKTLIQTMAALAIFPSGLLAQIAWETPRFIGPDSPEGFGVHWVRAGTLPEDGDAVMVTWAFPGLPTGVTLRGGGGRGAGGDAAGFGGVDLRTPIVRHRDGQPLDLAWVAGAGLGVGQYALVSIPMGVSAGRVWSSGSVWLAPHLGMGISLDLRIGDDAPDKEFEASPYAEVGVDLALDAEQRFVIRAAASLGDRQAVGVGAVVRTRR
jgi:hypothetical protein